jgi:8-oxo-dGTP diphosphatase
VVVSPRGLLVGRRVSGWPRWVLPGGKVEPGESVEQAAVREVFEECGLHVQAGQVLGQRRHPTTGRLLTYVVCSPVDHRAGDAVGDVEVGVVASGELDAVEWLAVEEVDRRLPDLFEPVRAHLATVARSRE